MSVRRWMVASASLLAIAVGASAHAQVVPRTPRPPAEPGSLTEPRAPLAPESVSAPRTPRAPSAGTSAVTPTATAATPTPSPKKLPRSGSDVRAFGISGLALVGAGLALLVGVRRRRKLVAETPIDEPPLIGW